LVLLCVLVCVGEAFLVKVDVGDKVIDLVTVEVLVFVLVWVAVRVGVCVAL
jgi:hypothetical protein